MTLEQPVATTNTVIRLALEWARVMIDTATATFIPKSGWRETNGLTYSARAWMEARAQTTSPTLLAAPCMQLTNDPRNPASGITVQIQIDGGDASGFANGNNVYDPDAGGPQTVTTQGYRYMRSGWIVKASAAGNAGADLTGTIELRA